MSVVRVDVTPVQNRAQRPTADQDRHLLDRAKVGEEVNLRIAEKFANGRYSAFVGDTRHIVESSVPLNVGQTVRATVSAVGGIVELKYLGAGQFQIVDANIAAEQQGEGKSQSALERMQSKFKITLSATDQVQVKEFGQRVGIAEAGAMSALYLAKLGAQVDQASLQALHEQQEWTAPHLHRRESAIDISSLLPAASQGKGIDSLAKLLADAVDRSTGDADASDSPTLQLTSTEAEGKAFGEQPDGGNNDSNSRQFGDPSVLLAHRLLNLQDSGTVAYHYGTLPVMVAGQLVELDLALFRERRDTGSPTLKKLVMTLKTESLGQVEIVAQSVDTSLSVSIATQSPHATEKLAAHAQEVRNLVTHLGWKVDSVAYRLSAAPTRAAEQLVRHVLNSGTLDAVM